MNKALLAGVVLLGMTWVPLYAQEAPPKPCSAPEYRQFDFWIGEWSVEAKGKPAGTNKVTAMARVPRRQAAAARHPRRIAGARP
ncbi:MAG: hypothetical protein ACE5EO_10730 [Candidatus Krumholzibacteriia bacterium]